jgi:hypothetical protein
MMRSESFECNAPDVVFENFGDEVVLLNLQTGCYYTLDPIGMVFWDYLVQGVGFKDIVVQISTFYNGRVDSGKLSLDLDALLAEFESQQLIRPSNITRSIAESIEPKTKLPAEYVSPALAKFDDVAEMLLLDPVHDVGDAGWPNPVQPEPGSE